MEQTSITRKDITGTRITFTPLFGFVEAGAVDVVELAPALGLATGVVVDVVTEPLVVADEPEGAEPDSDVVLFPRPGPAFPPTTWILCQLPE